MNLHVVYRSSGGENSKNRPGFYSKLLSLASFARALENGPPLASVVFLNDGPIPEDRMGLMRELGDLAEVPDLPAGVHSQRVLQHTTAGSLGLTRSWLAALALPDERGWPDEDVVYFVEDDYMHQPDALTLLAQGARDMPAAAYLALYGAIDMLETIPLVGCGNGKWYTGHSTTSTFAARLGPLRSDSSIHRLAFFAGGTGDRTACLAYQGIRPFQWNHVLGDLLGGSPGGAGSLQGRIKRATLQTGMNLLAMRSGLRRHVLAITYPPAATHVETGVLAPEVDWEAVAAETAAWARDRGLTLAAGPA